MEFEIDISPLEDAWEAGRRRYLTSVLDTVQHACVEGANEGKATHTYQNRTGELELHTEVGGRFRLSETLVEGEIVANMPYASYVETWEDNMRGETFMDRASYKAARVLEAGLEVGAEVLENTVNSHR